MIIQEKIRAIAANDTDLTAAISGRIHLSEAPQQSPTAPYAIFHMSEEPLRHQNSGLSRTRVWMMYVYVCAEKSLEANRIAVLFKRAFCLYKETPAGATDTDIQAITLEQGLVDLERESAKALFPCSIVLKVTEKIGA